MSARRAPATLDEWTVEYLWQNCRENYIRSIGDLPPDAVRALRDAFMAGALGVAAVWHGLELRRDIDHEARRRIAARFVSEGRKICSDMDLPEALRAGLQ